MLTINVPSEEFWDSEKEEFVVRDAEEYEMEHSLVAVAKWEAIWHKPFLVPRHTTDEMLSYFQCMCLYDPIPLDAFSNEIVDQISKYISDQQTATRINARDDPHGATVQTAETIYATMAMANVPFECDKWNINRLLIVLKVISERNKPEKKMSNAEILAQNRELNAQRRAELHTKG